MESTFPSQNLRKDPGATFIRTDSILLEVRNQKEGCCAWSLIATTSRILALKLTAALTLLIRSLSLFVSNPYLTSLDSACISFTLTQVYSLVTPIIESYRYVFTSAFSWTLCPLELMHHWCWASTLHGVGPPLSHVTMISPAFSCIHHDLLSKRTVSPIAFEAHFGLEVCTLAEDVLSRHRHSKKLFLIQSI
jgi:hypothetical protein